MDLFTLENVSLLLFIFVIAFQLMYVAVTILFTEKTKPLSVTAKEGRISILIPAYNEEKVVENCLASLHTLNYENFEVFFINDGSTDNTMEILKKALLLTPSPEAGNGKLIYQEIQAVYRSLVFENIYVIDKLNGGKADSLNAGSDFATGDVIITLDADSILEPDSLLRINEGFQDESVIAAGGMVHVGQMRNKQGKPSFKGSGLLRYQLSEYLTSFYVRKFTQSKLNVLAIVSGAFGAFRRELLYEIGGYKKTLGEDMEITLNIQKVIQKSKRKKKMIFIPEAICYTEVPESLRDAFKQRTRWQKGFTDCLVKYRKDFFGSLGLKFSLFFFWDSIAMALLGIVTTVFIVSVALTGTVSTYFLVCLGLSLSMQALFRTVGYWAATRHNHSYNFFDYLKIVSFFFVECLVRPFADSFVFVYGSVTYFLLKDKHNWNGVKRLGNVTYLETEEESTPVAFIQAKEYKQA